MKILFVVDRWSNGGVPTVIKTLSLALKAQAHEVVWLFYYRGNTEEKEFEQIELNARFSGDPVVLMKLKSIINSINPDIIHDHFGGIWSVGYLFSKWKKRAILHYHNEFDVIESSPDNRRTLKEGFFKSILLQRFRKIVAVSSHNAKTIQNYLKGENRVLIITNSVDLNKNAIPIKEQTSHLTIGFIGRLVYEKGLDSLFEALALLKNNPNLSLKIAGDGDEKYIKELKSIESRFKLNQIEYVGRIENKAEFFNSIDVMYFGSRQEPFGLTILEAWSYGVPIIGFYPENGGGPYELLKPGTKSGGTLIEGRSSSGLAQLIERVQSDSTWIERHTIQLQEKLTQFGTQKVVSKWIEVYNDILKS